MDLEDITLSKIKSDTERQTLHDFTHVELKKLISKKKIDLTEIESRMVVMRDWE